MRIIMAELPPEADNIRAYLGRFIGQTIIDITQQDPEDQDSRVYLHLSGGCMLSFPLRDDQAFTIHDCEE
jgi:hypothetical protein